MYYKNRKPVNNSTTMAMSLRYIVNILGIFLSTAIAASEDFNRNSANFAVDIYQKTAEESPNKNIILSPLSVETCLGLVYMGAANLTAQEIAEVLKFGVNDRTEVGSKFEYIVNTYTNNPKIKIANKVYVQKGYRIQSEYKEIATKSFKSEAENIDFSESVDSAAKINQWVEEMTNYKIKDLVNEQYFSADTRVVLVNAIHFKGIWKYQFNPESTRKSDFYKTLDESIQVDMMHVKANFDYKLVHELGAMAIRLPYKDYGLSMLILLPKNIGDLPQLEEKLHNVNLLGVAKDMYSDEISLHIPKFKIEFSIKLKDVLKKMGLNKIFSGEADFSNLLATRDALKVTDVVHKAFIEVNEEGTEAAAATGAVLFLRSEFAITIDHPFFFAILDSNSVLFEGRVVDFPQE